VPRLRTIVATTFAVAFLLLPLTERARAQDGDAEMSSARSFYAANGLLNRGHYELAVDEYRSFLEASPAHEQAPIARYGLGVSLFRLNRLDEARAELAHLQSADGFAYRAEVLTILGQCHLMLHDLDAAVRCLSPVVTDYSNHELGDDAAVLLVEALYYDGKHAEASATSSLAVDIWPDSPLRERTELFGAMADMALGDYRQAAQRLRAMTRRFPNGDLAGHASLLLAQSLQRSSVLGEAAEQYRRVIRRAEEQFVPGALYGLGSILHQQDEHDAAGELIDEFLRRFPDDSLVVPARMLRGRIHFALQDHDEARALFTRVAASEGDHQEEARYWAAKCDLRTDEHAEAAQALRALLDEFPETERAAEIQFDLAVALSRSGETAEARAELGRFLGRFPDHALVPDAMQLAATLEHAQERYEASRSLCQTFLTTYVDHPLAESVAFLSAENSYLLGEYERSVTDFTAFLAAYSRSDERANAVYRLGMALYRLQRFDEAEPFLTVVGDARATPEAYRPALLALGDLHFQREQWPQVEAPLKDFLSFGLEQAGADDALLRLTLALYRQEKFEPALAFCDLLIGEFPDGSHQSQAVFERGQILVALQRPAEAAEAFLQVLDSADDASLAIHSLNQLGSITMNQQRFDEAAGFFGQVARDGDEAQVAPALFQQGQALMAAKEYEAAESVFATLTAEHPESERMGEALAQRALALARLDKHTQALDQISATLDGLSDDLAPALVASLLYEKAWCLRALEEREAAGDSYRDLIDMQSEDELYLHALLELAELEADEQQHEEAARLLRALLNDAHRSTITELLHQQGAYRLGVSEYELGRFAEATKWLDVFTGTYPEHDLVPSALLLCGEAHFKAGAHQRATIPLRDVIERFPDDDDVHGPALLRLGECMAALQHWARSEEAFRAYLDDVPDSELWFQARFGVAWALENQMRFQAAITEYQRVVDHHNGSTAARAQFQIGECLFAQDQYEDAARELLKVDILYAYPEWGAAALYEAGRCFEAHSQPSQAVEQFQLVQQKYGDTQWAVLAGERLERLAAAPLPGRPGS
jgi:TolA-binding protein